MNFGDLPQQLRRINARTVLVMFGRQECLDHGKDGLADFKAAFEKLLDTLGKDVPKLVVVGPAPFGKNAAPLPDLGAQNVALAHYSQVMREIAEGRGALFVDVFQCLSKAASQDFLHGSCDGVQFNRAACSAVAQAVIHEWREPQKEFQIVGATPNAALVRTVVEKNNLWHDYWRPSNWAFLYGDRTSQPSSRDPVNPQIRLFPSEQQKYLPLIKEAEEKVFRTVEETTKRLP